MRSASNTDVKFGSIHSNLNSCALEEDMTSDLKCQNLKYYKSTNSEAAWLEIQFCWASFHIAITVKFEEKQSFWINGSCLTELNRLLQRATGSLNKWW